MERDFDGDGVAQLLWELEVSYGGTSEDERSTPAVFDGRLFVGTGPFPGNDYHIWAIKDP
jgi:hypothetical protein